MKIKALINRTGTPPPTPSRQQPRTGTQTATTQPTNAGPVTTRTATGGGLVAVVMWGLAPVATRALVSQLAPLPLLVLRLALAGLALLPWSLPVFRQLERRSLIRLVAAGALGMIGYNLPVTVGLQWVPAAPAGLLLATEPLWVLLIAAVLRTERPGRRAWLGSGVALGGVLLLAGPQAVAHGAGARNLAGIALVLLGTLGFAAYTIALRPLSQAYGALPATAATTVTGALPYLAFAGLISAHKLAALPGSAWGELLFLAFGSTVAGMLLWNRAVLSGGSTRVSLLLYLEPLVSVVSAVLLLGERPSAATLAGGVLVLAGVLVTGTFTSAQPRNRRETG